MNPVENQNKVETCIKCKKCGTESFTITKSGLNPCKCESVSADRAIDLVRVLGIHEHYEVIK